MPQGKVADVETKVPSPELPFPTRIFIDNLIVDQRRLPHLRVKIQRGRYGYLLPERQKEPPRDLDYCKL